MLGQILLLLLITCLPFIELRLAIPVGMLAGSIILPFGIVASGMNLSPLLVFFVVVVANILLAIVLYNLIFYIDRFLRQSIIKNWYAKVLDRAHRRLKKFTKRYGLFGVALFIAVPLPGSGVYSGALGAFVLGLSKRDFYVASAIGVFIAASIVTFLTLGGMVFFS